MAKDRWEWTGKVSRRAKRKAAGEMEEQSEEERKRVGACARGRDGDVVRGKMWLREKSLLAVSSFSEFLLDFYPR